MDELEDIICRKITNKGIDFNLSSISIIYETSNELYCILKGFDIHQEYNHLYDVPVIWIILKEYFTEEIREYKLKQILE